MARLYKFPRTPHIEGSRLQPGDDDLERLPFGALTGTQLVVTEKVDGANAGISFAPDGSLRLQSRGHYLTGGPRERHFTLFKAWAAAHQHGLYTALGDRHVLYGEWLYAKHTVFYDALPHYFLTFDVLDRVTGDFLDSRRRAALLVGLPVQTAPSLWQGAATTAGALQTLLGPSRCKTAAWRDRLRAACLAAGLNPEQVAGETDATGTIKGLYLTAEQDGRVVARAKFVRGSFSNAVLDSGSHWLDRPIVPNQLREGVDIFAPTLT